ncbi:hypothetical protein CF326_g9610, partial [Tilletia indica]
MEEGIQVQAQQLQSYRGLKIGFDPEKDTWSVHATFVDLNKLPEPALNGRCRPIVVLTVDPVPTTSSFRMRFNSVKFMFTGLPASFPMTLDGQRMEKIRRYTMRLLQWIGRQPQWLCRDDDMPYVLVPIKMEARNAAMFNFEEHIDMYEVERLEEWTTKPLLDSGMSVSHSELSDRILLERHDEDEAVVWAMTSVTGMGWLHLSRIERMQNWATGILEHDMELESYHTNVLAPTNLWVHAISASVYRSGLVMPTILDRIHQALSAQRCNKEIFEGKVAATHLVEALTVPSASYSFNYERLEFLGDTFLKLMATAYVFAEEIESQEGLLYNAREDITMNRTLLKHCTDHKLNDFMLLQSFTSRA